MPFGDIGIAGYWNAQTNDKGLKSGKGIKGEAYIVDVAGTTSIDGNNNWQVGDVITFGPDYWIKLSSADFGPETLVFETTVEAIGATLPAGTVAVQTYGYYEFGDFGEGLWKVVSADPSPIPSIAFANGLFGEFVGSVIRPQTLGGLGCFDTDPDTHPDQGPYLVATFEGADAMLPHPTVELIGVIWPHDDPLPDPLWNHYLNFITWPGSQLYMRTTRGSGVPVLGLKTYGVKHTGHLLINSKAGTTGGIGLQHKNLTNTANVGEVMWDNLWIAGTYDKALVVDGRLNRLSPLGNRNGQINRLTAFSDIDFHGAKFWKTLSLTHGGNISLNSNDTVVYSDGVQISNALTGGVDFGDARRSTVEGDIGGQILNSAGDALPPAWSAVTNYALNDVVTVSYMAYISLQNGNLNHTPPAPDTAPTAWWAQHNINRGSFKCFARGSVVGPVESNWNGPLYDEYGNASYPGAEQSRGWFLRERYGDNAQGYRQLSDGYIERFGSGATAGTYGVCDIDINADFTQTVGMVVTTFTPPQMDTIYGPIEIVEFSLSTLPGVWNYLATYSIGDRVLSGSTMYISLQNNNTNHDPAGGDPWWAVTTVFDYNSIPKVTAAWSKVPYVFTARGQVVAEPAGGAAVLQPAGLGFFWKVRGRAPIT